MKGKYIDTMILMACSAKRTASKKDIHAQLQETINERKKIMQEWNNTFFAKGESIHEQLRETIAEHKKLMKQLEKLFTVRETKVVVMSDKHAA